ncbi:MAG: SpoIIE family protein phosphatase [Candidatus Omnitrophota bacterium]
MVINKKGITFKLVFFILTSCTIIFTVIFSYYYIFARGAIIKNVEHNAKSTTLSTLNKIDTILRSIEKVPENLAYFLEQSAYTKDGLVRLLTSVVENNSEIYGSTIAFEPFAFDKDSYYFAPYAYKNNSDIYCTYLGSDSYKYFSMDWYMIPKEINAPNWSEPYNDEGGANIIMSTYTVPFYSNIEGKRKFMGVVTADISLAWLQDIVSSITIGKIGYGFLISKKGTFVTHPEEDLVMDETIFSIAEKKDDQSISKIGRDMVKGETGFLPFQSLVSGKPCWISYMPLLSSGWSLAVLFPQDELMEDINRLNWTVFAIGFIGLLFLLGVIVFISSSITLPLRMLSGATNNIAKGNLDVDIPNIQTDDEVGHLARSFIYMRSALKEYIFELTKATAARERMESELKIASDIQMSFLPKKFPPFPEKKEIDIFALLKPARQVGGDFYDFFFIDEEKLCFVIGDVAGKGVPAALFMAVTKTILKVTAVESKKPEKILERVNKEILYFNDSYMFATIFCGILDIKTGKTVFSNGGHNPPFLLRKTGICEVIEKAHTGVVGTFENAVYKSGHLMLFPGDTICMYTDGITEALNSKNEMFTESRLEKELMLVSQKNVPVKDMTNSLLETIENFSVDMPQSDDITLLTLRYFGEKKEVVS